MNEDDNIGGVPRQFFQDPYTKEKFYTTSPIRQCPESMVVNGQIKYVLGDSSGGVAEKGERYGWDGMQEVRSTYSFHNPDSLVIFAMALSMEEYF